ncbi:DnaJ (Hsp40), sub C, member 17 [Clonorchis sinensis]|uniref:DnaJ (Hsp40), sub C, member 17 n=1 Tax=Clonorchis sinensis TaxID=79923 RepID=A0A3R7DAL9_CLOSI|nr:DnaJ (Hsp40), sub C, member 17 [Clonorchis sinensis]
MDVDLYAFFGLKDDCSAKDLKRAYKTKARELHPDKNASNPKAKEEFQQLKDYYDLLHDPVTRKEYDKKWKAKREALKRYEALDEQRKQMRQKLEAQEAKAKQEREKQKRESAQNAVAEQLRREWQRQTEQIEIDAQVARKRHREEQEMLAEQSKAARMGSDTVVKVKWTVADNPEAAAFYTKDFLTTCLSEFGEVTAVMLGKRGTALVDFHTPSAAREAVECSERSTVGLPQLPLHISFVSQPSSETDTAPLFGSGYAETVKQTSDRHTKCAEPSFAFESFESDILSRMANFTG